MRLRGDCRSSERGQINADEPSHRSENQYYQQKAQTTRNRVTGIYTDDTAQFVFVDTPGFQTDHRNALNDRLNQNVTEALGGVDVVVFVVEAMRLTDADRVVLKQLPKHTPVILVINKIDKDKAKDRYALEAFVAQVRAEFEFAAAEAVSAKHGLRIANLLELLKPYLPESVPMYPEDMVTDKSARFWRWKSCVKNSSAIWARSCLMR